MFHIAANGHLSILEIKTFDIRYFHGNFLKNSVWMKAKVREIIWFKDLVFHLLLNLLSKLKCLSSWGRNCCNSSLFWLNWWSSLLWLERFKSHCPPIFWAFCGDEPYGSCLVKLRRCVHRHRVIQPYACENEVWLFNKYPFQIHIAIHIAYCNTNVKITYLYTVKIVLVFFFRK